MQFLQQTMLQSISSQWNHSFLHYNAIGIDQTNIIQSPLIVPLRYAQTEEVRVKKIPNANLGNASLAQ